MSSFKTWLGFQALTNDSVNELSNTIDLESTLIRAEQLFRRFQRLIEAIDKKQNFPAPKTVKDSQSSNSASASGPSRPSPQSRNSNGKASEEQPKKTITPELRKLLSRNIEVLPRKVVQKKDDGITTDAT